MGRRLLLAMLGTVVLVGGACSSDDETSDGDTAEGDTASDGQSADPGSDDPRRVDSDVPQPPPPNPFLADSVVPIGHFDTAQSDTQRVAGPTGPTQELGPVDLQYTHLGPGHFGLAISPPYPDGRRVVWSNGGDRISKLDYDTLEVLAELPVGDGPLVAEADADEHIARLDALEGRPLADEGLSLAIEYLTGLAGVYYMLDSENTLFVGGAESILAYADVDSDDPASEIELVEEWAKPPEVGGKFVGANMTYDGRVAMVTDEGWLVLVTRDFTEYEAIQLVGAEEAPGHNAAMAAAGNRPGTGDWVRNSLAVDPDGGIYLLSFDHAHKVVWDGADLSTDEADGAWTAQYSNTSGLGSGATPSLMGFGEDEDQFVVFTDGDTVMNMVFLWRDEIPDGWAPPQGAPSPRVAGQLPADMGDDAIEAIQTEQSVVLGGYGAMVVNNEPASAPEDFPSFGNRILVGYAGADPAFTPTGIQKFEWAPESRQLDEAWVNGEVSSVNSVPVMSLGSGLVYTVGARDGEWTLEGIDWTTGDSAFHWTTRSGRYNSLFSGINVDEDGRLMHTTAFGIVRYVPTEVDED